jgi:hypothetical protein
MKKMKSPKTLLLFVVILGVIAIAGCPIADRDLDPPQVIATVPIDSTTGVALNGTINMTFSEAMDPETIVAANYSVVHGATPVAGVVTYDASTYTAIFTPTTDLLASTGYIARITTGAEDAAGNALATDMVWSFVTGSVADNTPPTVVSMVPIDTATGVAVSSVIIAHFSEGMDTATINTANFTVASAGGAVTGIVTYDVGNKNAIFSPSANLAVNTLYTATIRTGVKDLARNALAVNKVWTFTTIIAAGAGPAPVNLRTAGNFAILAKAGISTVPDSIITGDIGVSPIAETGMTGFSQTDTATAYSLSTQVTGFMYAASMAAPTPSNMTTAISNMQTAYTDAAGRPAGTGANLNLGGGTLSGNTLSPGTYTWGTGVNITGDITISGATNDVWIFQIAGTLNLSNGIDVLLGGTAQAKNIFWQVSGAVTLGTSSIFEGTILGQTGITLQTSATVHGRVLAQTLVALQVATVTKPAP